MAFRFCNDTILEYESMCVLHGLINNRTPQTLMQKFFNTSKSAQAELLLKEIAHIYDLVKQNYCLEQEWLKNIFSLKCYQRANSMMVADMIIPFMPRIGSSMFYEYSNQSQQEQINQASKAILDPLADYENETGVYPNDSTEFFRQLDAINIAVDAKYEVLKLFYSYSDNIRLLGKALEDVSEIISDSVVKLRQHFDEKIKQLEHLCNCDNDALSEFTGQRLQFPLEHNINVYAVLLSTQVDFCGAYCKADCSDHLMWGVVMPELAELRDNVCSETDAEALRTIAEKTKFEILRALCDKPLYGSEIAAKIGITSATVSHHISDLLNHGLIGAAPQSTRVYYSANKEKIVSIINSINQLFK